MNELRDPQSPAALHFADERGASRSKWVAGILALVLIAWMGSGYILPAPPEEAKTTVQPVKAIAVAVRDRKAQAVTQVFTA